MKVLIIEDEEISFRKLKRMLLKIQPTMEIEGPLTTTEEVVSRLSEQPEYDLVFSDIRLRGRDVFEAFEKTMPECMIIFTTAYDEYAITAFKHNGIEYLLKPIDAESLESALNKVEKIVGPKMSEKNKINAVISEIQSYRERLLIWKGDDLIPVNVRDILYFYFDQRRVYAKTADNEICSVQFSMSELEDELDPKLFFRLNRQYIANIDSISHISIHFNSRLCVHIKGCSQPLTLSKEKSSELREWLDR